MVKSFFYKSGDVVGTFVTFGLMVAIGWMTGEVLFKPLAPIITFLIVATFTILTFGKWQTATLAITGLGLCAASWPMISIGGAWAALTIYLIGFTAWILAVYMSWTFSMPGTLPRAK